MSEANRFDEAATTWDEEPRRVELARGVADAIVRVIRPSADMDVLDFGCGTGLLTIAIQPLVRSVTSADTSSGMLDVLKSKLQRDGVTNVQVALLAPETELPLDTRFHLIVSSMALHHVPDLEPLFSRFSQQLRPGGRVALADLDREDGSFHEDPRGVFHKGFERAEVSDLLTAAGFGDLAFSTAAVVHKESRAYPVFLVTGRKAD